MTSRRYGNKRQRPVDDDVLRDDEDEDEDDGECWYEQPLDDDDGENASEEEDMSERRKRPSYYSKGTAARVENNNALFFQFRRSNSGLHQRQRPSSGLDHHHHSDDNGSHHHRQAEPSLRPSPDDKYKGKIQHHRINARLRKPTCGKGIQTVLLAVSTLYLCFLLIIYRHYASRSSNDNSNNEASELLWDSSSSSSSSSYYYWEQAQDPFVGVSYSLEKRRLARSYLDQREVMTRKDADKQANERARMRRHETSPPPLPSSTTNTLSSYTILRAEDYERPLSSFASTKEDDTTTTASNKHNNERPATMEELCGFYAETASLAFPDAYSKRDALGPDSRVLITGILNNPIGFRLALTLKEHCGVQVMAGLDAPPMQPNTMEHRLSLLQRMQILTTNIPKLIKPIILPFVGLDPKQHGTHGSSNTNDDKKKKKHSSYTLPVTGELDLIRTFRPTHVVHLASYAPHVYRNSQTNWRNLQNPYVSTEYEPALYQIQSSMTAMEQLLASLANANATNHDRPHFVYASSSSSSSSLTNRTAKEDQRSIVHRQMRLVDEILADTYYASHGIYSVAMRLPNTVYGPWGHFESDVYKMMQNIVDEANNSSTNIRNETTTTSAAVLDMVYVDDVVEALIAAMQFRMPSSRPTALELVPRDSLTLDTVRKAAQSFLLESNDTAAVLQSSLLSNRTDVNNNSTGAGLTRRYLQWSPQTSIKEGLVRTLAWHFDQAHPFGKASPSSNNTNNESTTLRTGDALLERFSLATCAPDDLVCHSGRRYLPCASECSSKKECVPSVFDSMIPLMHEVIEGCDVVLYTEAFDTNVNDLNLETEYMEEGNPLICTLAFVAFESKLVQTVVHRVPNDELAKLGVTPRQEDHGKPEAIHKLKQEKLNGRLLYRGWILMWPPSEIPNPLPHADAYLLKMSPGRLFGKEVKHAVFIEQSFGVSPRADDIEFLVHEMHRLALPKRTVKRKTTTQKTKFRLSAEPERRAVILMPELRYQDSPEEDGLVADTGAATKKITVRQATRFMRYENGEEHLGKESPAIKSQREFYERASSFVNGNHRNMIPSSPAEPLYSFQMHHYWVRSRWVVHDMELEEGRQLRCDWYQEHVQWGGDLDQLSFAYVMARREVERRMAFHEVDDRTIRKMESTKEILKMLTDAFEWHSLKSDRNRDYSPYGEMQALPYDHTDTEAEEEDPDHPDAEALDKDSAPLFARIISDRIMSFARKSWNKREKKKE